jgi:uncharacterized membrane protein YhfC
MPPDFINALLSTGSSKASQYVLGSQAVNAHDQHMRMVGKHGQEAVFKDVDALLQQLSPQVSKVRSSLAVCALFMHGMLHHHYSAMRPAAMIMISSAVQRADFVHLLCSVSPCRP